MCLAPMSFCHADNGDTLPPLFTNYWTHTQMSSYTENFKHRQKIKKQSPKSPIPHYATPIKKRSEKNALRNSYNSPSSLYQTMRRSSDSNPFFYNSPSKVNQLGDNSSYPYTAAETISKGNISPQSVEENRIKSVSPANKSDDSTQANTSLSRARSSIEELRKKSKSLTSRFDEATQTDIIG